MGASKNYRLLGIPIAAGVLYFLLGNFFDIILCFAQLALPLLKKEKKDYDFS